VPVGPQFLDVPFQEGSVEVFRQLVTEYPGATDSHIGISRKIEIEIERVCIQAEEYFPEAHLVQRIRHVAKGVPEHDHGKNELLEQAVHDPFGADRDIFAKVRAAFGIQLFDKMVVAIDRSADKCGEEEYVVQIVIQAEVLDLPFVAFDEEMHHLERRIGDPDKKNEISRLVGTLKQHPVEVGLYPVVFEKGQEKYDKTDREKCDPIPALPCPDRVAPVKHDPGDIGQAGYDKHQQKSEDRESGQREEESQAEQAQQGVPGRTAHSQGTEQDRSKSEEYPEVDTGIEIETEY